MRRQSASLIILALLTCGFADEKPRSVPRKPSGGLNDEEKEILKNREILENLELLRDLDQIRYLEIFADKERDRAKQPPLTKPAAKKDSGKKQR